ncbi:MAG: CoB--CoM heterodisulfide reductase iron-sulfur subunit A family protein [Desulfomonile sp.]|jgi:quinone-modifying oxidoreductase subunit QmoA|nr:CoB--CoM heterodisulfide reductase iron-sulfur subunit A family protein [Deltaproteobacteria bacterium]
MGDERHKILVVGGGISGMTAAVEAAEAGSEVILVEKNPYLGGRVTSLNQYFPKLCPPYCGLEINFRRIKQNPKITFHTLSEVESVNGGPGNFAVTVSISPRYVNDNCTACGKCAEVCDTEIPNAVNYGMDSVKAAYLPHAMAFPFKYVLAPEIIGTDEARKCAQACDYNAIDLEMKPAKITYNVGAIVWATGWDPYEVEKVDYLGLGKIPNVVTSLMFERLAAHNGPTGGKIVRPSDGKEVKSVAFVQCAGSRDENHLAYCSGICCLASLKHATYIRGQVPESKAYIYYIDVRAMGKYEDFYMKVDQDENVILTKSKIARISEDLSSGGLIVEGEDIGRGEKVRQLVDLVVLAVGMVPSTAKVRPDLGMEYDDFGFATSTGMSGIIPAGCVKAPMEVAACLQDATAAALKAIQGTVER